MFNWFDLMRQAQTQAGFETLARQFQLSGEQQQRTMAALMPAFVMGLCRYVPRNRDAEATWENQLASLPGGLL